MTPTPGMPGGSGGGPRPPMPYPYSPAAGIRPGDPAVPPGYPPGPLHNGGNVGYARPMVGLLIFTQINPFKLVLIYY